MQFLVHRVRDIPVTYDIAVENKAKNESGSDDRSFLYAEFFSIGR